MCPYCPKCYNGNHLGIDPVMVPLSSISGGVAKVYDRWVCTNPDCDHTIPGDDLGQHAKINSPVTDNGENDGVPPANTSDPFDDEEVPARSDN